MDFSIVRGEPFTEEFNFKTPDGYPAHLHGMAFEVVLERGQFVLVVDTTNGLSVDPQIGRIDINLAGDFTACLPYSLLKYTLLYTFEGERTPVASGMVIVN